MVKKSKDEGPINQDAIEDIGKEELDLAVDTLSGDMADALLDRIKKLKKPWEQMPQGEQRDLVAGLRGMTEQVLMKACDIIAGHGRHVIHMGVEKLSVKKGLGLTLTCNKTKQALMDLGMAEGDYVLVVIPGKDSYVGERAGIDEMTDDDQPDLMTPAKKARQKIAEEESEFDDE